MPGQAKAGSVVRERDASRFEELADDMFALGLVADLVLAPNPMSRPSATEVMTRAQHLLDTVAAEPVPPPVPAPAKVRWTPPMGIRQQRPTELGQVAVAHQRRTT